MTPCRFKWDKTSAGFRVDCLTHTGDMCEGTERGCHDYIYEHKLHYARQRIRELESAESAAEQRGYERALREGPVVDLLKLVESLANGSGDFRLDCVKARRIAVEIRALKGES